MISYSQRLEALYKLEFFGMKLGLDNIRALLARIGNPERTFDSIHIAGTNGKGSVSAMLAGVHQRAGKKTGLYTSPHLVEFGERIRIDGEMISEREALDFLDRVWPIVEELHSTFFEVTTAMAFDHFARHTVDIAIIETGLGGRLDATNVLEKPLATVVTSIGHDHHAQLGPTLEDITREKAGIFKPGVPAIVNCQPQLNQIFLQRARTLHAPITLVSRKISVFSRDRNWIPPFPGAHQMDNLRTVRATLEMLPYRIPVGIARRGIRDTTLLTGLRGRLEEIPMREFSSRHIRCWVDVGHNPEAIAAVGTFFKDQNIRPTVIFGIMRDKEIEGVLQKIKPFASEFIAIAADTPRALPSDELAHKATTLGLTAKDGKNVRNALAMAMEHPQTNAILLGGSHYIVGEFFRELSAGTLRF